MKRTQATTLAALISTGAMAADTLTRPEFCSSVSEAAELLMSSRLHGVPMREAMAVVTNDNGSITDVLVAMVRSAYAAPDYQSDEMQAHAIAEFGNEWYGVCIAAGDE